MSTTHFVSDEQLRELGFERPAHQRAARRAAAELATAGYGLTHILRVLASVRRRPAQFRRKPITGDLARALLETPSSPELRELRAAPVPRRLWGAELLDGATQAQFDAACRLPVAVRAAQMPDGHVGYGLPIGGVLAVRDAVIPYAVGVDIACRMRLTIFDQPADLLERHRSRLRAALIGQTRFGVGAEFEPTARRQHAVMDDPAWAAQPLLTRLHTKAWAQLGTSGSGNHFAEWGDLVTAGVAELGLPAGRYLALLTHGGSRGTGAAIADHFTRVAKALTPLPKPVQALAWLPLDTPEGQAYWQAMELAGRYAAANHELVHAHIARAAGLDARAVVDNHHNFAWREEYDGEQLIVHRKGATPAGAGVLGVIPGSMGDAGYVVRGRGAPESLNSASHGAGRNYSRTEAKRRVTRSDRAAWLARAGVELIAGGLDESPQAYRPLERVMAAQVDLVEPLAKFMPRLVLMASDGLAED